MRSQFAATYGRIVEENLSRTYPYVFMYLVEDDGPIPAPVDLYPAFHTSYDWHSCVHMHWLGVEVLRSGRVEGEALRARIDTNLTAAKLSVETDHLRANPSFERPYGWAWAARLGAAVSTSAEHGDEDAARWSTALGPLIDVVYDHAVRWSEVMTHPVREGAHSNTAFGLTLLLDAARSLGRDEDAAAIERAAVRLFEGDVGWPGAWETSGQDFLSAGLSEADLMSRVLSGEEFARWFAAFLPDPISVTGLAVVADKSDGQMAHLDGLNLSRAGALYRICRVLGTAGRDTTALHRVADELFAYGLESVQTEEYVSSHWLASFAWDAMIAREELSGASA